jgi:hypothetical protein
MLKTPISKIFTAGAIALSIITINSAVTHSQTAPQSPTSSQPEVSFICDTNGNPPTTYALSKNDSGKATATPIITWYSEYILPSDSAEALCQQMAQRLQSKHERGEEIHLSSQRIEAKDETTGKQQFKLNACLVGSENENCKTSSDREELFGLNPSYKDTLKCLTENTKPDACPGFIPTRGSTLAIPAGNYKPSWLSWFF